MKNSMFYPEWDAPYFIGVKIGDDRFFLLTNTKKRTILIRDCSRKLPIPRQN
jgi:hypothetical protein